MNEELQKALSEVITKATQAAERGTEFLAGEIPEVIQQLLMWHMVEAWLCVAGLFVISGVLVYGSHSCYKAKKEEPRSDMEIPAFFLGMFAIILLFPAFYHFTIALKIILAPKLYLLEYAAQLVK